MKKLLSILLSLAILGSLIPFYGTASAAETSDLMALTAELCALTDQHDSGAPLPDTKLSLQHDVYVQQGDTLAPAADAAAGERYVSPEKLAAAVGGSAKTDASGILSITADDGSELRLTDQTDGAALQEDADADGSYISDNGVTAVPLDETAEKLGVTVAQTDTGVTLSYAYQHARLIVVSSQRPADSSAEKIIGGYDGYYFVQYKTAEEAVAARPRLLAEPGVECVDPDAVLQTEDTGAADYQSLSWGPDAIGSKTFNKELISQYGSVDKMPQITVAVLDTGADLDHPFYKDRLVAGYNYIGGNDTPEDDVGHGTHIAGIIADTTLPNVKIMPLKVGYPSSDGSGKSYVDCSKVITAVEYAETHGVSVMNMSFGGMGSYPSQEQAINEAYDKGILSVVSAGNDSKDASYYYPADFNKAITVAALKKSSTDGEYEQTYFTNYGNCIDLAAPGYEIVSTFLNGKTANLSGTSMAAPFVAAAAAAVKTKLASSLGQTADTSNQITRVLCLNAKNPGSSVNPMYYGYGMLYLGNTDTNICEATIGNSSYTKLSEAISAAKDGDTITVPWSVYTSQSFTINKKLTIRGSRNLQIRRAGGFTGPIFDVVNGGDLTLTADTNGIAVDGEEASGDSLVKVEAGGSFTLGENAILKNNVCTGNGGAISNSGTVTICGGAIRGTQASGSGDLIFNNGILKLGGTVSLGVSGDIYLASGAPVEVISALAGSSFVARFEAPAYTAGTVFVHYADGLTPEKNRFRIGSDTWELEKSGQELQLAAVSTYEAKIGSVSYPTLAGALTAATSGQTVEIIKSICLQSALSITKNVTLTSPGGYSIGRDSSYQGALITVGKDATLTLGSGDDENLTIDSSAAASKDTMIVIADCRDSDGNNYSGGLTVNPGVTICGFTAAPLNIRYEMDEILSYGTVTINGGSFCDNNISAAQSALITNISGRLTVNNGHFLNNKSITCAGIHNTGTAVINGGLFENNYCKREVYDIYAYEPCGTVLENNGTMTINGGTFVNNTAETDSSASDDYKGKGGSVCNCKNGTMTITGGTFTDNVAKGSKGGAVYNMGKLKISGGTISGNSSTVNGGGVYVEKETFAENGPGELTLSNDCSITGNTVNGAEQNIYLAKGAYLYLPEDFTNRVTLAGTDGNAAGTLVARAETKTRAPEKQLLPETGTCVPCYDIDDTEAPFDIYWTQPLPAAGISGTLRGGMHLQALIDGRNAAADEAHYAWYYGDDPNGSAWTQLEGETAPTIKLPRDSCEGKYLKLSVTGRGVKYHGTVDYVSTEPVQKYVIIPEDTPAAAFTATGPDCGTLSGVTTAMQYSLDGGGTWTAVTAAPSENISGVTAQYGIIVRQPGIEGVTTDSEKQTITVKKTSKPNLTATQPTSPGGKGSIPMTGGYDYSTDEKNWIPATGTTELEAGTYYIRISPIGAILASDSQIIVISSSGGVAYTLQVNAQQAQVDPGGGVTATIMASSTQVDNIGSFTLTMDYDSSLLDFVSLSTSLPGSASIVKAGSLSFTAAGSSGVALDSSGVVIATAKFTIKRGIESCTTDISLKDVKAVPFGYSDNDVIPVVNKVNISLKNIKIRFQSGTGAEVPDGPLTAFERYMSDGGLFTDDSYTTSFTIPAVTAKPGYRLANKDGESLWTGTFVSYGKEYTKNYTDNSAVANAHYDFSTTFTPNAVRVSTLTFGTPLHGSYTGGAAAVTVDSGSALSSVTLPAVAADSGFTFAGWFDGGGNQVDSESYIVSDDVTLTPRFKANSYTVSAPTGIGGIPSKADTGTDLTFTPTVENGLVTGVSCQIGGGEPQALTPNADGSYTIAGSRITGDIVLTAGTLTNASVDFISAETYRALTAGTEIAVLRTAELTGENYLLADGTPFYWSPKYASYLAVVRAPATAQTLSAGLKIKAGSEAAVSYGDLNGDGVLNEADGALINDILHQQKADATALQRLECDFNGDKMVSTRDIVQILYGTGAAPENQGPDFQLTANGAQELSVSVGENVNVTLKLDGQTGDVRCLQNYIRFDSDCFDLIAGSVQSGAGSAGITDLRVDALNLDGKTDVVFVNRVSEEPVGYPADMTLVTFTLKAKKPGRLTLSGERMEISANGGNALSTKGNDCTVDCGDAANRIISSSVDENGCISATAQCSNVQNGGVTAVCAVYNGNGKMIACCTDEIDSDGTAKSLPLRFEFLPSTEAREYSIFILNATGAPLSAKYSALE